MSKYAEIIVKIHNLKEDRAFTYRIPPSLSVEPGSRVLVPFGSRTVPGYCIALTDKTAPGVEQQLKDILAVLDEQPVLTPELISLAFWGAKRYLCSVIDFLEAMVPATLKAAGGHKAKTAKYAELTKAGASAGARGSKQQLALQLLKSGPVSLTDLEKRGVSRDTVRTLEKKGWVRLIVLPVRRDPLAGLSAVREAPLQLTPAQQEVLAQLARSSEGRPKPMLLYGVTGSGKTEVYLQAIACMLQKKLGSIVLVPEIALTPQMTERFVARFGSSVAVLHSRLSAGERYDEWCRVARGEALVVIGARSAVFAPVRKLGLLILDEEHEITYKQEEVPRYHARDIALRRAEMHGAAVILGSATPSLESYTKALRGEYLLAKLPRRIADRPLPPVEIVDMREELKSGNKSIFSRTLQAALRDTLAAGRQAIIFLNRRGYATFVLCRTCGHVMRCPACNVSLKFHSTSAMLCCHYCDHQEPYPAVCPACGSRYIRHFGAGTQKVEEELRRHFPAARPLRLDADTAVRKGVYQKILACFRRGEANVLVGTQMIAKGLDFPKVTLVGVVTADTALNLPDFRAGERTFQMLTQVAGRAGRGAAGGRVVIQTYTPEHYAVTAAREHDFETFYREESARRKEFGYPPFGCLVRLLLSGGAEEDVAKAASLLAGFFGPEIELWGPSPCPLEKVRGRYRWQLVLRGNELEPLLILAREAADRFRQCAAAANVRLSLDVEPLHLL
ncbi:MAG: primosomal protein N' [Firmicutes bacterium]|nr:primosomal protein N' [Bacillota bacterium]